MVISSGYCSPRGNDIYTRDKTCFTKDALIRLAEAWNAQYPDKIRSYKRLSKRDLWANINLKMSSICTDAHSKEACWVDNLEGKNPSKEVARTMRPVTPDEWKKNEYTWLTNYDIEDVMSQYDYAQHPHYKYKFLGVFPIDFQARTMFGTCLFKEFCSLDITRFWKKGIRYLGMITNLDKHNQSGSHWTSLFICIDPQSSCFGAYYYDSVATTPPMEIVKFMDTLKEQVQHIPGGANKQFIVKYNKMRHQRGNTECGIFSIDYQIRWITALQKNPHTKFEDIAHNPRINDAYIHQFRKVYFRPFLKKSRTIKTV